MKKNHDFFTPGLLLALLPFLLLSSCSSSGSDSGDDGGNTTNLTDTSGTATVTEVTDKTDAVFLSVLASFPADSSADVDVNTPIVLFMDDKILSPSLTGNYTLTAGGSPVSVSLSISASAQGNAILIFKPAGSLPFGSAVDFTLNALVKDDGNNGLGSVFSLSFTTSTASSSASFDGNGGFESASAGVRFIGDGAVLTGAQGGVSPAEGKAFAVITCGDMLVSSGSAIGGTTSILFSGPITKTFSKITFKADFASSEFNDFVDSEFDDTALFIAYGPAGVKAFTLTSVNIAGKAGNTQVTGFAGLPDEGDSYAGHTGWKEYSVSSLSLGTPAYLAFVVSDVGDAYYASALAVDAIEFQ